MLHVCNAIGPSIGSSTGATHASGITLRLLADPAINGDVEQHIVMLLNANLDGTTNRPHRGAAAEGQVSNWTRAVPGSIVQMDAEGVKKDLTTFS